MQEESVVYLTSGGLFIEGLVPLPTLLPACPGCPPFQEPIIISYHSLLLLHSRMSPDTVTLG